MQDRKTLKINAREAMAQTRPRPFWVTLAVCAVLMALSVLSMFVSGQWDVLREFYTTMNYEVILEGEAISFFAWLLDLALSMMIMVLSVGYALYALKVHRRESASFGTVLDAFGVFFRAVWISYLRNLIIGAVFIIAYIAIDTALIFRATPSPTMQPSDILWLTLIAMAIAAIPALIVRYSYSQSIFIMLDNPQLGVMRSLMLSRAAMRGHKWEFFKLELSFLGWMILSIVPFVGVWVMPYKTITQAGYYDALMPDFMARMQTMPVFTRGDQPPAYHVPGEDNDDSDDE